MPKPEDQTSAPKPERGAAATGDGTALINQNATGFAGGGPAPSFAFCGECLVDSSGRVIERSTVLRGNLEQASIAGDNIVFVGWAADITSLAPVPLVVLVSNEKVVSQVRPDLMRPDVATMIKAPEPKGYGFRFVVPATSIGATATAWMVGMDGKVSPIGRVFRR